MKTTTNNNTCKKHIATLMLALLAILSGTLYAQSQTGYQIMKRNKEVLSTQSEKVNLKMQLINKKGKTRTRELKQVSITDVNNNRSSLLRFLSPADVEGVGFLSIENSNSDDDQWLYLPALGRSRRISASNESDNFMGSDFTYEDIGTEDIEAYIYSLVNEVNVNGEACYLIEATPSSGEKKKDSGYSKREIFVSKNNYMVVKTNYYNKKGELAKTYTATEITPADNSGKIKAHRMEMKNLLSGHTTVLHFNNYTINAQVQPSYFTQRFLENGN